MMLAALEEAVEAVEAILEAVAVEAELLAKPLEEEEAVATSALLPLALLSPVCSKGFLIQIPRHTRLTPITSLASALVLSRKRPEAAVW